MVSTRFATVDGWVNGPDRDFDYGVIFVDDPEIGRRVGNFAVDAAVDADLTGAVAHISGYPFDRDRAEFQYYHARPIATSRRRAWTTMWTPSVGKRQPDLAPAGRRLTDRDRHPHDRQRDGQFGTGSPSP